MIGTLRNLTSDKELKKFTRPLSEVSSFFQEGVSPEVLKQIRQVLVRNLQQDPSLAKIKVVPTPGFPGGYFPRRDLIALGVSNPAVMAHELGHAKNLRKAQLYDKLIAATQSLARLNTIVSLPVTLAIKALVRNSDTQREVFNILSGTSAALAAPALSEELGASMEAIKEAPDKLQALKTLIPAFLTHVATSAFPVAIYQSGKLL